MSDVDKMARKWSVETGLIIIYETENKFELEELWNNFNRMPLNLQKQSDLKSIQLYGCTNRKHYEKLYKTVQYNGFPFIIHQHEPRNGTLHYDLRFMDLKNSKLLHSFALPENWLVDPKKTVLFKTRDHDVRWLTLKSYRLKTFDEGVVNYKIYKPYGYFLLEFTGKTLNGLYQLFKLRDKVRKDAWMLVRK